MTSYNSTTSNQHDVLEREVQSTTGLLSSSFAPSSWSGSRSLGVAEVIASCAYEYPILSLFFRGSVNCSLLPSCFSILSSSRFPDLFF